MPQNSAACHSPSRLPYDQDDVSMVYNIGFAPSPAGPRPSSSSVGSDDRSTSPGGQGYNTPVRMIGLPVGHEGFNNTSPRHVHRAAQMPGLKTGGGSTPEFRYRLESATPETARQMAMKMYASLKKHGLREEADQVDVEESSRGDVKGETDQEESEVRRKREDLMGMEYLMRDGFVSYLRDVAKITPPIPQQVVRFSGIQYSRKLEMASSKYETFGNKIVGCFVGPFKALFQQKKPSTWVTVLKGVDGYIMPGSMTLLLGPPGCGKSTLLEILAGRVEGTKNSSLQGVVMYNDKNASEVRLGRLIAYISSQLNKHLPFLSVRETLEFARDCTQGLRPENFTPQMRKFFAHALVEGQDPFLEYVLEILDLKNVQDKLAGEAISDVDRQKLTTAELALVTSSVMIYDQPFSGSDLAATYDLVDTIRTISRIQQSSAIMSLTQISQEVFDLFDRIILLGEGHVLFQGPRQDAVPYFTNLGYCKPPHVESAEFLEDIVAGHGLEYMAPEATPFTIDQLIECYQASEHFKDMIRIARGNEVKLTYWIESEPGIGLSLKTPSKYNSAVDVAPRQETELVVAKLSTRVGNSGGIESTGRIQLGDVVTAISMGNDEMEYLAVGSQEIQRECASHVYSTLKKARGQIRLQVERYKDEEDEYQAQWKQFQRPFVQTWWKSTITLVNRQIKITKRLQAILKLRLFQVSNTMTRINEPFPSRGDPMFWNDTFYTLNVDTRLFQSFSMATILGLFAGTLFYQFGGQETPYRMSAVRSVGFVSTMSIMLINLVQFPLYMLQRPIFYKHRAHRFFRASSYIVAHCIVNLPQSIIEALVYALSSYFLIGLSSGASFFEYLLLLVLVAYLGSSLFFFFSTISSIQEVGMALAGLIVSIFLLFSGFMIYPSNVPTYWKWLLYIDPLYWANISYCRSQFKSYTDPCSNYIYTLPCCNKYPTMTVGKSFLVYYELNESANTPWLPYVIILAWILIANLLALLGLQKLQFADASQSLPQLKQNPESSNFRKDTDSLESLSISSIDEFSKDHNVPYRYATVHKSPSENGKMEENGGVEKWIEEYRVDLERSGLGIPVEPVTLLFEDLSFTRNDGNTSVFDNVTGYAGPRNMLALLGGSKSTKETLLKCLAGRVPSSGRISGNLQANGVKPGSSSFFRLIGYVEKLDAHQPYLSVRESLQFSAALRLGQAVHPTSGRIHVELVLNQLGLLPYSNQLVGSLRDATGKTFEIAKRMTIAVELAANPSILFLEEPISGLNSAGILTILNTLYQVSESGRVIIATLTHPNARSLTFFDHALILTREGHQAYFGSVGPNCSNLLDYFTPIFLKSPQDVMIRESPVSFVMGALGLGIKSRGTPSLNFAEIYKASSLHDINNKEIISIKKAETRNRKTKHPPLSSYPAPYSRQASLALLRTQLLLWRNVQYTFRRLTGCVVIGLLMGSLYFRLEYKDTYGMTSRSLYIYMQVILVGIISANNVIPQIGTDRLVYFREKRAGMYHPVFYPVSWAVGEIPYFLIATLAMVGIGNGMAGFGVRSGADFFTYWLVLFIYTLCVTYFGMMVTFLAPVPTLAAFAVSIVMSFWVSTSGVVVVLSQMSTFYRGMYWTNPIQYAMDALTSISFFCDTTKCRSSTCQCPQFEDGTYVWDRLVTTRSLNHALIPVEILSLAGMTLLFACLASLFFVMLKHNSRPPSLE